ncbi:(2Fe-2S)-binding protein [Kitasatospora purpeofusca]|uniref:(2Fe-2S)-binding protein n=1 Tax=Kitasatospora purpeofusca TaxID=67352 RepID=UPI0036D38797
MTVSSTRPASEPPAPEPPVLDRPPGTARFHGPAAALRTAEPTSTAHPDTPPAPRDRTTTPAPTAPEQARDATHFHHPTTGSRTAPTPPTTRDRATTPAPVPGAAAPAASEAAAVPLPPWTGAYRRLGEVAPEPRVLCAPPRSGRGWIAGAELLADPAALRELVAHDARQGLARYGRALRPDVAASIGLHRFVWPVSLLFTLPWFLERRVPLLAPADVSIHRRSGELTVRPGAFACLPDDPAARSAPARSTPTRSAPAARSTPTRSAPAARPVADETALAAELRAALAGFLTPVLAAFRPEVRRGPRTLWAMATDAVVEGLWYVGGRLGEEERARTELTALFAPSAPGAPECAPFTPGAGFTAPAPDSPARTDCSERCRASCCLVYTVRIEAMCAGCPRVTRG